MSYLESTAEEIIEELLTLGIDAEVLYNPAWREGPNVVCYECLTIVFKNDYDLNLYKTVGIIKPEGEEIMFDVLV